jgi:hypothetical protein
LHIELFRGEIVPRYFFHVHIGEDIISDPEGQEFPDADAAWKATKATARNIMSTELPQSVNWASCHIEVKDETGEIVMEFPFLEAIEIPQEPNEGTRH